MTDSDYEEAIALWLRTEGMGLSDADSLEAIAAYLRRNPGFSLVARRERRIVGAILCGHDGRRGYLHHLAVERSERWQGLGTRLVTQCLERLAGLGIRKCHGFVRATNQPGVDVWRRLGWQERNDLTMMSADCPRIDG